MMKKKSGLLALLCLLGFFLTACQSQQQASQASKGLRIVTSFYPIYSLVKEVSGDLNDVKMIQSSSGIHSFEPSANDVAAIYDADVFVYHSRTLESWAGDLDPTLQQSKVQVLEASEGMELDKVQGLEDMEAGQGIDAKTLYDPHTWLDPLKAAEEAQLIAQQLGRLDPSHAEVYKANAQKIQEQAESLVERYQPVFSQAQLKTFVTQHTAFAYLAKRFGLTQLGIAGISPEQEPSLRQLTEIQDFVKQYGVKTIFTESNASSKVAETLVSSTGVQLKTLDPLEADPDNGQSFMDNVAANLEILAKELK